MAITRSRQRRRSLSTALTAAILLAGTAGPALAAGPSPTLAPAEAGLTTVTSTSSGSPSTQAATTQASPSEPAVETVTVTPIASPAVTSEPTVVETVVVTVDATVQPTPTTVETISSSFQTQSTTSTNRAALEPAAVAAPTVLTDANGNTFSFTLTTVSDGTGHGTTEQCFMNSATGYTPGDNTPTDGIVCNNDAITYRVDWNTNIVTTSGVKVAFDFNQMYSGTGDKISLVGIYGDPRTYGPWNWAGGVTGGSSLGFTGWGAADRAEMTFTQTGAMSGYWTFSYTPPQGWNSTEFDGNLLMGVNATMGTAKGTAITDRNVLVIAETRLDLTQTYKQPDGLTTTIDGTVYRGIWVDTNVTNPKTHVRHLNYPGYSGSKGYYDNAGGQQDFFGPNELVRFSMLNAPAGTLVSVDGKTPVPVQWDGTTAYIDAPLRSQVKFFVEWGSLAPGVYNYTTRVDAIEPITDLMGQDTLNGATDPGVGLSCDVSTANLQPGSTKGQNMPNNNCWTYSIEKKGFGGGYNKWLKTYNVKDPDTGQFIPLSGLASPGVWEAHPEAMLYVEPAPAGSAKDASVCDVWDPNQFTLEADNSSNGATFRVGDAGGGNLQTLSTAMPNAVVYYTTTDLRPAGAPDTTAAVDCGSPSDTSIWTTTRPASGIAGVMIVFPGQDTLTAPATLNVNLETQTGAHFDDLITENVRDYMGYSWDTTVADPLWRGDTEAMTIYKGLLRTATGYEPNTNLGLGAITYTSDITPVFWPQGSLPSPDETFVQKIYIDNCMTNTSLNTSASTDVISSRFVEGVQDPTKCGTPSTSYYEVVWRYDGSGDNGKGVYNPLKLTWTTPVTSKPGDKYMLHATWSSDAETVLFVTEPVDKTYTVVSSAVVGSTKVSDQTRVEITKPYSYTLGWFNYSPSTAGTAQFIDVFPYNGDGRGTSFSGTTALTGITYVGTMAEQSTIEYTKAAPSTVSSDPAAASNGTGGTTTWCTSLSGGACPSSLAEVTAVRFTTANFDPNETQYYRLSFTPTGNKAGDQYWNNVGLGRASGLGLPIPASPNVQVAAYASSISGYVFSDNNLSETWETGTEPVRPDYTVELIDANGKVVATTLSDANGYYEFTNIVSAPYQTRVVSKSDDEIITVAGSDVKVEAQDWTTEVITVPANSKVENVNFGIAEKKAVTIQKLGNKCEGAQAPCSLAGAEFALYDVDPSTAGATPIADGVTVDPTDGSVFTTAKLLNGVYWLVETKAPSGMELLAQPIQFTLGVQGVELVEAPEVASMGADALSIKITDPSSYKLPATGGEGVNVALAGVLTSSVLAAGSLWALRKRKSRAV